MDSSERYKSKTELLDKVVHRETTNKIPTILTMDSWALHHTKTNISEALTKDYKLIYNSYSKAAKDIGEFDAYTSICNTIPVRMNNLLALNGRSMYVVNEQGLQKGATAQLIDENEYDEILNQGLFSYMTDRLIERKFPIFTQLAPEVKIDLLNRLIEEFYFHSEYNSNVVKDLKNIDGIPVMGQFTNILSLDIMLDYFRDFTGLSIDIRRHPNQLLQMCEEIWNIQKGQLTAITLDPKRWVFSPLHFGTYLRPKDFSNFYLSFIEKLIQEVCNNKSCPLIFFFEADYTKYLDMLEDLPKNLPVIGLWEDGDYPKIKEKTQDSIIFMGGIRSNTLKFGKPEDVKDAVKIAVDTLAPSGNFIISPVRYLMHKGDSTLENLQAFAEACIEYGKY